MSQPPPPQVVAAQEVAEATVTEKKRRTPCSHNYVGTAVSLFLTFPLLLWVCTLISRFAANAAQDHDCEGLLKEDPFTEAILAISAIMFLLLFTSGSSFHFDNRLASLGLLLVALASISVVVGFPNLEHKTTFGIFRSSDAPPFLKNNNNSEYWNNNIRACACKTEACEDMVYRKYFIWINHLKDFDSSLYTKLQPKNEPQRHISPAPDPQGTSLKNGDKDRSSPSSDSRYHEVCYLKRLGYDSKGNKTLCYDCYGCEEEFLIREQRFRWRMGNILYVHNLLLITAIVIVFLAESWERYME